jgi:hypothetical protein
MTKEQILRIKDNISEYGEELYGEGYRRNFEKRGNDNHNFSFQSMSCFNFQRDKDN